MSRTSCFIVGAVVSIICQLVIVNARADQPAINAQQIIIRTKLIEINRSKMRQLGVDFSVAESKGTDFTAMLAQTKAANKLLPFQGVPASPFVPASSPKFALVDTLCQNGVARILSDYTMTTVSGRAATLSSGSTILTAGPSADEKNLSTNFVGTKLKVVPHLVANNKIRVKYSIDYSHIRENAGSKQPGFPKIGHTMVDATFEVSPGETFVTGGLLRKIQADDQPEHFELLLLVTPELVSDLEVNAPHAAHVSQNNSPGKKQ